MSIFKKKEIKKCDCKEGCCGCNAKPNARFVVLGACCQKSKQTYLNAIEAVKNLGFEDEVVNVGDYTLIAEYGVMATPALVVNDKVVSYGKMLSVEQIEELIKANV